VPKEKCGAACGGDFELGWWGARCGV